MEERKGFLRGRRSIKGVYEGEKTKACVGGREDERVRRRERRRNTKPKR